MTGVGFPGAAILLVVISAGEAPTQKPAQKPFQKRLKAASVNADARTISVREPDLEIAWNDETRFLVHRSLNLRDFKRGTVLHVLARLHTVRTTTTAQTDSAMTDVVYFGTGEAYEHPPLAPPTSFVRWHSGTLTFTGTTRFLRMGEATHRLAVNDDAAVYSLEKAAPAQLAGKSIIVRGEAAPAGGDAKRGRVTRILASEVHLVELNAEHTKVFQLQWGETRKPPLGLRGEYFDGDRFTNLKLTRVDPNVNFEWGSGSPHPSIEPDSFSVRWTGQITPPSTGTFTFQAVTDDGVRLWVDGQLLFEKWGGGPADQTGTVQLTAGKKYEIRMEYHEGLKTAFARLFWSGPSVPKEIISQNYLQPAPAAGAEKTGAP